MLVQTIASHFRPPIAPVDESVTRHRVWLNDADVYRHLNNGRYLSLMDLGRLDLLVRTGLFRHIARRRWYPVVATARIRFLRSIDLLQRYEMRSRLVCWDDKAVFIEHRFERKGRLMAVGAIRGVFLGPEGKIRPGEVLGLVGWEGASPEMPESIASLLERSGEQF
jgi:acyl-CoA thioesterase FadM